MSAVLSRKAPSFGTSAWVEVDVDIDPEELEAEGWVFVGKSETGPSMERVIDTVRRWHETSHDSAWQFCDHELCHELRAVQP